MPSPRPTFEKIYIEMCCKQCRRHRYDYANKKHMCMLAPQIQDACITSGINSDQPGYMFVESES